MEYNQNKRTTDIRYFYYKRDGSGVNPKCQTLQENYSKQVLPSLKQLKIIRLVFSFPSIVNSNDAKPHVDEHNGYVFPVTLSNANLFFPENIITILKRACNLKPGVYSLLDI
jgi:hypothetical protein